MKLTKTKYNTNIIAPEYDNDDIAYIDYKQKQIASLPTRVQKDLYLPLSEIATKYNLDYPSLLAYTKYEI